MKIVDVRTLTVGTPWKNWLIVSVDTDEGLVGYGEGTLGHSTLAVEGAIAEIRDHLSGLDPLRISHVVEQMSRRWFRPGDAVHMTAISAIEIALWDILGKHLDSPLYQLLGGKVRDRTPVYANGWHRGGLDPSTVGDKATRVVEQGFAGLKLDPYGSASGTLEPGARQRSRDLLAAVRAAVGPDVALMVEAHDRFDVATAVSIAEDLADVEARWWEAPVWSEDIDALAQVAQRIDVAIAAGERFSRLEQFKRLGEAGVWIWQPEPLSIGGITGTRAVCSVAEAFGAQVTPHNARGPIGLVVNAHLAVSLKQIAVLEYVLPEAMPAANRIVRGLPKAQGGFLEPPEGPGLGIELDEEAAREFPYDGDNFLDLFEAGWELRRE